MDTEFRNIALVGRQSDARVAEPMRVLADYLTKAGINVTAAEALALDLHVTHMPEEQLCDNANLVIAIGGDGTMLYASRLARTSGTPILGVNRGRLGFLADITPDAMIASVDQVLAGRYLKDSRLLLKASLRTEAGDEVVQYGLEKGPGERGDRIEAACRQASTGRWRCRPAARPMKWCSTGSTM